MRRQGGEVDRYETLVVGGGSAGCVLAARLSAGGCSVCLVEAGPDYGPYDGGGWPADILDATVDAIESHDWGFPGGCSSSRAKILGGCSAHNGCGIVWPAPLDLDEWAAAGNSDWSFPELRPYLERVQAMLRTRPSQMEDLEPWRRAMLAGAVELGFEELAEFNDGRSREGVGLLPLNAVGNVRWNTAFAYLDPIREREGLSIRADVVVDRLLFRGARVEGVLARCKGREVALAAERVVLAAGAYGSPAILLRSGIGSPGNLEPLGIGVNAPLSGVGANLRDHPTVDVQFQPSGRLRSETARHAAEGHPAAQCLLKAQGSIGGHEGWNLVLGPWTALETGNGHAGILVTVSKPRSAGRVGLRAADPDVLPSVEHGFLSDDEGHDLAVLLEGVGLARGLGETHAMRPLRAAPGSVPEARAALEKWARTRVAGNYHACGTCRMGPDGDPGAVVDPTGRVHGVENLYVADASILPMIPRANIHLTVLAVAERIAELILGSSQRNRIA